jgi:porin
MPLYVITHPRVRRPRLIQQACAAPFSLWPTLAVLAMLTAWACPALAQEIATGNSDRAVPRQSSSSTLPAASAQAAASSRPSSKTKTRAATPPAAKPRKLNCRRAADPNRRRFGCKDQTFDWADTLTRDWFGIRADARDHGIALTASYYSALQTNATGGGHQVWGYAGQFTGGIDFDFEKLLHVPGMSLYFSHYWGSGSNLTGTIGSVFPVTTNLAVGDHLGEIYLQQKLDHGNLTLAAGRLAADYTFATLPVFSNYVSNGIDSNPVAILTNDHSYVGPPPGLEWGAQAIYNITKKVQAAAGIYNTNQNSANNGNVFALQQQGNKGALVTAQLTYLRNQGADDTGRSGQFTGGFFEDNNVFPVLAVSGTTSQGNAGIFLMGQQMLYRPGGPGTNGGLTVWAAWAYSWKQRVSAMPTYVGTGLSYEGVVWRRPRDIASVGWVYGTTSNAIPSATPAKLLEANYQFTVTRYFNVTPDFQYIWSPAGTPSPGAAVFGARLNITF